MTDKKPNVLIFYSDEHRFDTIGAYGNKEVRTPNIDRLAEDGILYQNSFCTYPVCTPSRYSFLTSLYPHQHLGWTNRCTLPAGLDTFPRIMKDAGYSTKAVGKMHFTPTYLDVGFEEMVLAEQCGMGRYDDDYHRYLMDKGLVDRVDMTDQVREFRDQASDEYWDNFGAIESNLAEEDYSTTWIGDRAVETIEDWDRGENLMMVGFIKPHHPFDPPYPWSEMYDPDQISIPEGWLESSRQQEMKENMGFFPNDQLTEDKMKKIVAYYYATISQIDFQIGRMIDLLKEKEIYDNTIIIYTSDHGDYVGFHHMILKGNYMYDPLSKVPLIIKLPGQKNAGTVSDALVNNIDVSTTILGEIGCHPGEYMEGIDLIENPEGRDLIFTEGWKANNYMVRSRNRKLLLYSKEGLSQYINLEEDPLELNNLIDDPIYQDEIAEYKDILGKWLMFETPTPVYLDEGAKVISSSNVPHSISEQRKRLKSYFAEKMEEEYEGKNILQTKRGDANHEF